MIEVIVGIDIGKEGAISLISKDGKTFYDAHSMPGDTHDTVEILRSINTKYTITHTYIEKQAFMNRSYGNNPFARQGGKAAFTLGHSQGVIEGALLALAIPYTLVSPRTWQKVFEDVEINSENNITTKKLKETKIKSYIKARELYPNAPLRTSRGKVLDGVADALLIAYWGSSMCYDRDEKPKEQKKTNDKSNTRKGRSKTSIL